MPEPGSRHAPSWRAGSIAIIAEARSAVHPRWCRAPSATISNRQHADPSPARALRNRQPHHCITPRALLIAAMACISACASAAPPQPGTILSDVVASAARPSSSRETLTETEIRSAVGARDAYAVVQKLRPVWLQLRGDPNVPDHDGSSQIIVYSNGARAGGTSVLRDYDVSQLISIRWVNPIIARSTYGGGHGRGLIAVTGR